MKWLTTLAFWLFVSITPNAATIHIPGDYPTIQQGIDAAVSGDLVLLAPGHYRENISILGKHIELRSDVDGDPETHDIDPANTIIDGQYTDTVVRFVGYETNSSILDGFTITNGKGMNSPGGGGILCDDSRTTTIRNNIISDNRSDYPGGGIHCRNDSSPIIDSNTISGNIADVAGGGIYCDYDSGATITNNTIEFNKIGYDYSEGAGIYCGDYTVISHNIIKYNTATGNSCRGAGIVCKYSTTVTHNTIHNNRVIGGGGQGGGIYCDGDLVATENLIEGNRAGTSGLGGGICVRLSGTRTITENVIRGNEARLGGGISVEGCSPIISNNDISYNYAYFDGGGIFLDRSSNAPIQNNTIFRNESVSEGGGIACEQSSAHIARNAITENEAGGSGGGVSCEGGSSPTIENNLICGNSTKSHSGGGIYCESYCNPSIVNNTLHENTAEEYGGGICSYKNCNPTVTNSILWGNSASAGPEIWIGGSTSNPLSALTIEYSDVEGGQALVHVDPGCTLTWGSGMIDADPLFYDPANSDYHLQQDPCQPGTSNPCVDSGNPSSSAIHGTTRTDGVVDCGNIDMGFHYPIEESEIRRVPSVYATIQCAIEYSENGDIILVAPGTYYENITVQDKTIEIRSDLDGESGTHDIDPENTIIDGYQAGSVVKFDSCSNSLIEGFTITNGYSSVGGGVYCYESSNVTISRNIITQNSAASSSYPKGGGIYCAYSSVTIASNTVSYNLSNATTYFPMGAGICIEGTEIGSTQNPIVTNNLVYGNETVGNFGLGGGIYSYCDNGTTIITGNTVFGNSVDALGGGIHCKGDSNHTATITNTIAWGNSAPSGPQLSLSRATVEVDFSDLEGGQSEVNVSVSTLNWGANNIDTDPLFVDPSSGDFHIEAGSPCIDTGNNAALGLPDRDMDDEPRIWDGDNDGTATVDMGADEYNNPDLVELVYFRATGYGNTVLVDWQTASEIDTAGFHIWRSEKRNSEEGDFVRITGQLIPAEGGPSQGATYEFFDFFVVTGHPYCYRLEDIDFNGESTFHEPVVARWRKSGLNRHR